MKFDCGESHHEKWTRLRLWHIWFAWYPIRIASHDCRWLEKVERRFVSNWYEWTKEYRGIENEI